MAYTDIELRAFTQIAYMDFGAAFEANGKQPINLGEVMSSSQKQKLENMGISAEQYNKWTITSVCDKNAETGFYACVIETSPGEAAVGFRGSEGFSDYKNFVDDWGNADLKLLNSTLTTQQSEVDAFLAENKALLNGYKSLEMTGHSLGGNLAEYATIMSSKYGLDDNITRCVSLDGPGFSDEFMAKNRLLIEKMSGKMTHYSWSLVGGLLNMVVPPIYLQVSNDANKLDDEKYNCFTRHDTKFLAYDKETGMFIAGERDDFALALSIISNDIDDMPSFIGDALVNSIIFAGVCCFKAKKFLKDSKEFLSQVKQSMIAIATVAVIAPAAIIKVSEEALMRVTAAVAFLAVSVFEIAYEMIDHFVATVCDTVGSIIKWTKDKIAGFCRAVCDTVKSAWNWIKKKLSHGNSYSEKNPHIIVDTYSLRGYASRLDSVNKRIASLDYRLDALYGKVGLLDLGI